jgi:hypothetical protein
VSTFKKLTEQIIKEAEDKAQIDALSQAMGAGFNVMGSELKSKEDELKKDVEQADVPVTEAIGVVTVIGMILAAPKVIELITKGISKLVQVFKKIFKQGGAKTEEEQSKVAKKIIDATHKWHKGYIKGLKWIFKVTGLFKKAGIKGDAEQERAAEFAFYVIIAGLAVWSGVQAIGAFKSAIANSAGAAGNVSLGALEAAMAQVKAKEVTEFLAKLGIK